MKLVTFQHGGSARAGLLVGSTLDTILDVAAALPIVGKNVDGRSVLALVEAGKEGLAALAEITSAHAAGKIPSSATVAAKDVTLLAPIPRPPSMRDGYAFRQHVETARRNRGLEMIPEFDQFPVFYFTNHQAVIGPGDLRVKPKHLDRLDFELEAAIVVGKECRDLTAANADDAIFGMAIMNDFSARALQMDEMKLSLGPAKGKDFATGIGPWLVTMDELAPAANKTPNGAHWDLGMRAFVNGTQVSTGNVKDMTWTFAQILERASYGVTLFPGDVIGSGTCGTGCFLELNGSKITNNQWLQPGDVVALEIDRLGRLENKVVATE
ncbi:MAG: fumarylacetoacetate hydrolase family protein [Deltaproteobacteria bacterium]|nr:fumarylacetoacetate hydrolase family protein [Deltaproteobacteria bacterium]